MCRLMGLYRCLRDGCPALVDLEGVTDGWTSENCHELYARWQIISLGLKSRQDLMDPKNSEDDIVTCNQVSFF